MNYIKYFYYRKSYTPQVDNKDSGVAALATIAKYHGSFYSLATLREFAQTTKDGTTAFGIVTAAKKIGFLTKTIQADKSLFEMKELPFPFIVHVLKERKMLHYYVIYDCYKNYLVIGDPDPKNKVMTISMKQFLSEWTGVAIFLTPSDHYTPFKESKRNLLSYLPIIFKQKLLLTYIIIASLSFSALSLLSSIYIQQLIDYYIPQKIISQLELITLGLIISYIIQQVSVFIRDSLLAKLNQRLVFDIEFSYLTHLFQLPINFFATRQTGEITSRFNDGHIIIEALAASILSIFLDFSTIILIGLFLIKQNGNLFFFTLASIPLYLVIITSFVKVFEKLNEDIMESNAKLNAAIIDDINGIESIKSLTCDHFCLKRAENLFQSFLSKSFKLHQVTILQNTLKQFTLLLLNLIILWQGSKLIIENTLSVGQLIAYTSLLTYFSHPLENIINLQSKLQSARVASNRLNEIYSVQKESLSASVQKFQLNLVGRVTCHNLSYSFNYTDNILSNINLQINPGEKVAFVGQSGSGKTTLAKLLVGFYPNYSGHILINNHNLTEIPKFNLRTHIHYVPQKSYIFNGTILENVKLGCKSICHKDKIEKACKLACIHEDIQKMPLQYKTEINDISGLSGGQKQRIALARSLLSDSPILILDEITNGLDKLTEKNVINNLLNLKEKTIIFITHHDLVAKQSDQIIVLERGNIIEQGTYLELTQRKDSFFNHFFAE